MRYQRTEKTAAIYNAMIKEYREISCDGDLEKAGLDYEDYRSSGFGLFLDCLRYDGVGVTGSRNIAEWAERHGCHVSQNGTNWTVRLQEREG